MPECICPFSATLSKNDFSCEHAQKVIRRGGEEFSCQNGDMHTKCSDLYAVVRPAALQAMGKEDNLLTLPHSVLTKIQFGCLLGLQAKMANESENIESIENIATLIRSATEAVSDLHELPMNEINQAITNYKPLKRRRK